MRIGIDMTLMIVTALLLGAFGDDPLARLNIRDLTEPYPPSALAEPYRGIPPAVIRTIVILSQGRPVDVVDRENVVTGPRVFVVRIKDGFADLRVRIGEDGAVLWRSR
jgi:hypothetical protein